MVNGTFIDTKFIDTVMLDTDLRHSEFNNCVFNKSYFTCTNFTECKLKTSTFYQNIFDEVTVKYIMIEECKMDEDANENLNNKAARFKKENEEKKRLSRLH